MDKLQKNESSEKKVLGKSLFLGILLGRKNKSFSFSVYWHITFILQILNFKQHS